MRLLSLAGPGALAAMLIASLAGCRAPTQITVEVSTDVPCEQWNGAAISVGELGSALETRPPATTSSTCDAARHVGTLVVVPSGAENANVAFRVVGAVGQSLESCSANPASGGCIVARRALNFIPHETLTVSVPLEAACKDIPCDPSSTCVNGVCRPATLPDPALCASNTCGEGALPPADGGAADATLSDAGADASAADAGSPDATTADAQVADTGPPPFDAAGLDVSAAGCGTACAIALGDKYSCVKREAGVWCWGQNVTGECGNGTAASPTLPPAPVVTGGTTPLSGVTGIVAGADTSCAFLAGGGVACWGAGSPLGLAASDDLSATTQPALASAPLVSIGNYHMCWGSGAQLSCQCASGCSNGSEYQAFDSDGGTGVMQLASPPGSPALRQLSTTYSFTCALAVDGTVYCLGQNGTNESEPAPGSPGDVVPVFTRLPFDGGPALEIASRFSAGCLRTVGHVFCWGANDFGENGSLPGVATDQINEVTYAGGGPVYGASQLAAGAYHFCALLGDGHVACWGNNANNELGRGGTDGGIDDKAGLVLDADGGLFGGVSVIAAGTAHTCAIKTDGSLWCWGSNDNGQAQPSGPSSVPAPARIF